MLQITNLKDLFNLLQITRIYLLPKRLKGSVSYKCKILKPLDAFSLIKIIQVRVQLEPINLNSKVLDNKI
jgi:hypothetical protein